MKERPIIFSGPMVLAILEGKKTQTRRLKFKGEVGDRLWVREPLIAQKPYGMNPYPFYEADCARAGHASWDWKRGRLPAMFMPKRLARIRLEVLEVRNQILADVSAYQAQQEGFATLREFREYWDELHKKHPNRLWAASPLVKVITFKRIAP